MKKFFLIFLISVLLFVSCKKEQEEAVSLSTTETEIETDSDPVYQYAPEPEYNADDYVIICGEKVAWNGVYIIEPDSKLDIEKMDFSDFGDFFSEKYPVEVSSYKIAVGEPAETAVYHIHSENPGPVVYIAAGIHGNERAAWYAGLLMKDATIKCGDLYVLSQANIIGARNISRFVEDSDDPNRFFPGKDCSTLTEKLDWAIFTDIEDKNPEILLDLHEAILYTEKSDFLGSTYIFTDLNGMDDLFFDMLFATQDGEICHNEFGFTGPGPAGSMNNSVTTMLGIPTITIETFRGFDIYRRVADQLDSIQYVLKYKGMR